MPNDKESLLWYWEMNEIFGVMLVMLSSPSREILLSLFFQILPYLRKVQFNNSAGEEISFSENGLGSAGYDLLNWVSLPNLSFVPLKVGQIDPGAPLGQEFTINTDAIVWTKKVSWV